MKAEKQIFKNGSTTYYWSSMFFPERTRDDVFKFYSFVRIADNFVDSIPQNKKGFLALERCWKQNVRRAIPQTDSEPDDVALAVKNMHYIYKKYAIDRVWITAFLRAMKNDLSVRTYKDMEELQKYMYGSAEVIGLIMAKIIGVPGQGYESAKMQGRAMQYINFIRDIAEDIELKRQYIPQSELAKYGLKRLTYKEAAKHPGAFRECIEAQIAYYQQWQKEAYKGYKYIPRTQRIALRTATDMYNWTARQLAKNPFLVFDKKVKPSKSRVVGRALIRTFYA